MARRERKLTDSQLKHIADVEAMIANNLRHEQKALAVGFECTARAYRTRADRLQSRIDEIRAGINFGV